MKRILFFALSLTSAIAFAQARYTSEVFTQASVSADVTYATNISFLLSDFSDPQQVAADVGALKTAVAQGNPIPAKYYNPADTSTDVKVTDLKMDIYEPMGDTATNRPVVIYIHTGNFLPPGINGGINGDKRDSAAIVMCTKLARRGFVAIAPNYRLGWNPLDPNQFVRRAQLLNAVYRAIHDMKELVRVVKADASNLGIDKDNIAFFGEGSGGYVGLAYATLDKWSEVEIPKFINPATNSSFVDSNLVGNIEGLNGTLNLYLDNGQSTDIDFCMNMGGALADTSWLEAGDVPMVSVHCVRDPFAPFDNGTVVVPTTQDDVVDVSGANVFIEKANRLGNNSSFTSQTFNDPITLAARARYGVTYQYIFPAPFDTISVNTNVEGLYPVLRPKANSLFRNNGSPWQWWDPNGPIASDTLVLGPPVITYHMAGLASNPNMSSSFGRTYQDTILGYTVPRMVFSMNLISEKEFDLNSVVELYPNPTQNRIAVQVLDAQVKAQAYEILDAAGKLVLQGDLSQGLRTIDVSALQTGVYLFKLESNRGISSQRFVKQ